MWPYSLKRLRRPLFFPGQIRWLVDYTHASSHLVPRTQTISTMKSFYLFVILIFSLIVHADSGTYEEPAIISAHEFVPASLLSSDLYSISDDIDTHGFTNTYQISSEFGDFTAHGNEMLYKLIQEIMAINELEKFKATPRFAEAVKASASSPFEIMESLIIDPADTVSGLPEDIEKINLDMLEMTSREKNVHDKKHKHDLAIFAAHKRQLAYDLNVDVYSTNKVLQQYLNSVGWATYSSDQAVPVSLEPLDSINFTKDSHRLHNLLRDKTPEQLHKINAKYLTEMGIDKTVIEAFFANPWLTPRYETMVVGELYSQGLKGGLNEYIGLVNTSSSEQDAFFYQNITKLISHYLNNTTESEVSIEIINDFAVLKVRKHYVIPILIDNGYWSEQSAKTINNFERNIRGDGGDDIQILVWITGEVSDRAKSELKKKRIFIVENAYSTGTN